MPSGISRVAPLSGALAADTSACGYTSPASRTLDLPVHLLVIYPPKVRLSELVNSLKGVSSRRLKVEFPVISTFWNVRKSEGAL